MNKALIVVAVAVALVAPSAAAASTLPYLEQDAIYKLAADTRHETPKNVVGNIR